MGGMVEGYGVGVGSVGDGIGWVLLVMLIFRI